MNSVVKSMYNQLNQMSNRKLLIYIFLLVGFLGYISIGCEENHFKNKNPALYRKLIQSDSNNNHITHRHHHLKRHRRLHHHNLNNRLKKRCRYSETNYDKISSSYASKIDNDHSYNHIKNHQLRDGTDRPYYLGKIEFKLHFIVTII